MTREQQRQLVLLPAQVTEPDIDADNGLIHAVDAVLLPKEARRMIKFERKENQLGNQAGD